MPIISVDEHLVYFQQAGQGTPAIVFIHSSGLNHDLWVNQCEVFSKTHTVAAIDLNGHGQSESRQGDGLETYTQDVLSVLNHLDQPSVVVGHSIGGAVALSLALQKPDQLLGLGLISTGARLRVLPSLLQLLEDDFDGGVDYLLGLLFHRSLPEIVQKTRDQMISTGQAASLRDFYTCNHIDMMSRLREIDLPTWVCVGEHDQLTPPKYASYLSGNLEHAQLDIIPNSGHMTMLEQPDAFNRGLRGFLTNL
jgi:pimeloyl-ACP methyl ester carboxylesterase